MDPIPIILDQVRLTIDRLRECWSWLELLVEPGRETRAPGVVETDAVRELQFYRAMHEQAYKVIALQNGRGALAPTPAGARVSVIDARAAVHGQVVAVARRVAVYRHATYVGPVAGVDATLAALDWLAGTDGSGWVAGTDGVWWRRGALDWIRDAELAASVDKDLQRASRLAHEAARVDGDFDQAVPGVVRELYAPIDGRCPACRNKSLQLVHDGNEHNRRRWHIRCVSEHCRCWGAGDENTPPCGCRRWSKVPGRSHAWAWGELTGPYGLWRAMEAASPARPRVGSSTSGHGGWSDRRTG